MKRTEKQFLKENIIELVKDNKSVTTDTILDYLDYINKVKYSYVEIKPLLEELILEKKIIFKGNAYIFSSEEV